jgi:hypothetical protein
MNLSKEAFEFFDCLFAQPLNLVLGRGTRILSQVGIGIGCLFSKPERLKGDREFAYIAANAYL